MEQNEQIQAALQTLEAAGYKCLAPSPKREEYESSGDTPPDPLYLGKAIDCKTNTAKDTLSEKSLSKRES